MRAAERGLIRPRWLANVSGSTTGCPLACARRIASALNPATRISRVSRTIFPQCATRSTPANSLNTSTPFNARHGFPLPFFSPSGSIPVITPHSPVPIRNSKTKSFPP